MVLISLNKTNSIDSKLVKNLKFIIGKENFWTKELLNVNSTYNDLIWNYWHYFDGFPETGFLKPNDLTSFTGIDRAIRELPGRIKNISEQERYRKYYSQ